MQTVRWRSDGWRDRLEEWVEAAGSPGVICIEFVDAVPGEAPAWPELEPWTRTRAVSVAAIRASLASPALDIALCSDLVYIERDRELDGGQGQPSPGLLWALGRGGRPALARGLLDPTPMTAGEALCLGLVHGIFEHGEPLPLSREGSLTALVTARDLMRVTRGGSSSEALESAAFRLLFAAGDPEEGARAFLERRAPSFATPGHPGTDKEVAR